MRFRNVIIVCYFTRLCPIISISFTGTTVFFNIYRLSVTCQCKKRLPDSRNGSLSTSLLLFAIFNILCLLLTDERL